jgi:hypothetical protein
MSRSTCASEQVESHSCKVYKNQNAAAMLMYEFNANQHTSLCQGWGKRPAIGAVSQLNHNLHCCSVGGNSTLIRVVMTHLGPLTRIWAHTRIITGPPPGLPRRPSLTGRRVAGLATVTTVTVTVTPGPGPQSVTQSVTRTTHHEPGPVLGGGG